MRYAVGYIAEMTFCVAHCLVVVSGLVCVCVWYLHGVWKWMSFLYWKKVGSFVITLYIDESCNVLTLELFSFGEMGRCIYTFAVPTSRRIVSESRLYGAFSDTLRSDTRDSTR